MASKPFNMPAMLLLHILALFMLVQLSVASVTQKRRELTIEEMMALPEHLIPISAEEEDRIVALLGPDYRHVALSGLYTTAPAERCSQCGKETEFIDWIYTALAREIHSPEFILASLKAGNRPKKHAHDVYCSHCGALTVFQDYTGEEGNAPHIHLAPTYDRASKTFLHRREGELESGESHDESGTSSGAPDYVTPKCPVWRPDRDRARRGSSEGVQGDESHHDESLGSDTVIPPPPPLWAHNWDAARRESAHTSERATVGTTGEASQADEGSDDPGSDPLYRIQWRGDWDRARRVQPATHASPGKEGDTPNTSPR